VTTPPIDPEEAAALAVLDRLGRAGGPDETAVPETEDAEVEGVLRRLHEETVALLAFGVEPAAPTAALRARLLAAAIGDETQDVSALVGRSAGGTAKEAGAGGGEEGASATVVPFDPLRSVAAAAPERPRRGAPRWAVALAAGFALAALGLGLWSSYLVSELRADRARLAWAESEWKSSTERLEGELSELRTRFDRVTAASVAVYSLHCPTGHGPAAGARAYLYAPPGKDDWEFAVHGLQPEPPGREYQVWFLVGDEPRSAGCFKVRDGEAVFRLPERMPEGVTGVAVSIEPAGGSRRPTGDPILVADRPVRL